MPPCQTSAPLDFLPQVSWECADIGVDAKSDARLLRLTSSSLMSNLIYCETPFTSPDGQRAALLRTADLLLNDFMLLIADLGRKQLLLVEPSIPSNGKRAQQPWGEWFYYATHEAGVRRVSLFSLRKEEVLPDGALPSDFWLQGVTPDGATLTGREGSSSGPGRLVAYDTGTGSRRVLLESPHFMGHDLLEPASGNRLLFYELDGPRVKTSVLDLATGAMHRLPIGEEWSAESSGHHAWIPGTDCIACAVAWNREMKEHDRRHPEGNLLVAAPGSEEPAVFPAPEHGFYHVSVSRCGTYFVCDDFMDFRPQPGRSGPTRLVVGNLLTGKHRTLVSDCQAFGLAGCSWYEPCPYFTADNARVIYNASPFGLNQVFAAELSPDFLASLS